MFIEDISAKPFQSSSMRPTHEFMPVNAKNPKYPLVSFGNLSNVHFLLS